MKLKNSIDQKKDSCLNLMPPEDLDSKLKYLIDQTKGSCLNLLPSDQAKLPPEDLDPKLKYPTDQKKTSPTERVQSKKKEVLLQKRKR